MVNSDINDIDYILNKVNPEITSGTLHYEEGNPAKYPCIKGNPHAFESRYNVNGKKETYIYDICTKCGKVIYCAVK